MALVLNIELSTQHHLRSQSWKTLPTTLLGFLYICPIRVMLCIHTHVRSTYLGSIVYTHHFTGSPIFIYVTGPIGCIYIFSLDTFLFFSDLFF